MGGVSERAPSHRTRNWFMMRDCTTRSFSARMTSKARTRPRSRAKDVKRRTKVVEIFSGPKMLEKLLYLSIGIGE